MPFDSSAVDAIDVINVETGKEGKSLRISKKEEIEVILAQLEAMKVDPAADMQQWLLRLWSGGRRHRDVHVSSGGQWGCDGVLYGEADALPRILAKMHGKEHSVNDAD